MLEVGKIYSAETPGFKMHLAILEENAFSYTVNVTSVQGKYKNENIKTGVDLIYKYNPFLRNAKFTDLEGLVADDPKTLDEQINMSLDKRDKAWFLKLTEKKKQGV